MRKKKLTKEEVNAEIERQVREEQEVWLKEKSLKAEETFVEEALRSLVFKFKYEGLYLSKTLHFAKALIDGIESNEAKKNATRIFAEDMVYMGTTSYELQDREFIEKMIGAIEKYLAGQT